jgi:exodeoxyribonuclease VII large subunit
VWVEGEVSNLARPGSGHLYLTLKDEEAPLRAVVYRGVALRMRFDLRDGMRVVVRGRLSVYEPRGEYQLLAEEVHPKGIGPLELAFRQLKEKLSLLGYFEPGRKKPLPAVPRRIGIISSPTGSAVRDVLEVLAHRWPAAEVLVCPVHVQGEGAATEVAAALKLLNTFGGPDGKLPIDVLLIARGGGSLEDLWAFNEEPVAHAIYQSHIPVITGIGHEDDLTIADLVADQRALTPTEAAMRAVPDRAEVLLALEAHHSRMRALITRIVQLARSRLEQLADRPCLRRPVEVMRDRERRIDELAARMKRAIQGRIDKARARLEATAGRLEGLSPLAVLSRGYSLTFDEGGRLLRDAEQVRPGERLRTRLLGGEVVSVVEGRGK